jgi:hypothetical protein
MNIIPVTSWYPLVCPQHIFIDRAGLPNAYVDTNPAFFLEPDGSFTCLVRQVNYRKFRDRTFSVGGQQSNTHYHCLRGNYTNRGITIDSSDPVQLVTHCPRYPSYWTGAEDIRFVNKSHIIATYPECNQTGNPCMVEGTLQESTITITNVLSPSVVEKNWMPYTDSNGSPWVIYSIYPLSIKPLSSNTIHECGMYSELQGYHGSTNGIPYKEGWLFLIHAYTDRSRHRWLYFCPVSKICKYSDEFVFLQHSYIEFPCSLTLNTHGDEVIIGLGVNDDKAFLVTVALSDINLTTG